MKRLFLALFLVFVSVPSFVQAQEAGASEYFSSDLKGAARAKALKEVEDYLRGIRTMKASFLQSSSNGDAAQGTMAMARPGRMRLEYDPPSGVLVICNGKHIIYYDKSVDQVTYIDMDSVPATMILKDEISFNDKTIVVTNVAREPGSLEVTMAKKGDLESGNITLVFTVKPLKLKQWRVVDAQNITTTISLFDVKSSISMSGDLFKFKRPKKEEF